MCKKKKIQKAGNLDHIFDSKESTACLPDFELSLFLGKTSVSFFFSFFLCYCNEEFRGAKMDISALGARIQRCIVFEKEPRKVTYTVELIRFLGNLKSKTYYV